MTTIRKAIIGVANESNSRADSREIAGETHLDFATLGDLSAALTARRIAALRAVAVLGPTSVYAVAKHLARNYSNVHADVQKLLDHGLVEKMEDGRVVMPWDDVVVRVDASLLKAA